MGEYAQGIIQMLCVLYRRSNNPQFLYLVCYEIILIVIGDYMVL